MKPAPAKYAVDRIYVTGVGWLDVNSDGGPVPEEILNSMKTLFGDAHIVHWKAPGKQGWHCTRVEEIVSVRFVERPAGTRPTEPVGP